MPRFGATLQPGGAGVSVKLYTDQVKGNLRSRNSRLLLALAEQGASFAREEQPVDVGTGRRWTNAAVNASKMESYYGIIQGPQSRGGVPHYMGMIELGIKAHYVSLKHYGLRTWFWRVLKYKARPSARGYYRSVFIWKTLNPPGYKGPRRELRGGKVAIPWLSRATKRLRSWAGSNMAALVRQIS